MKKLLALIITLASVLTLASCLGGEPTPPAGDPTGELFTYAARENGSYAISGLTDAGKTAKELTIPLEHEGGKVTVIASGAFSGGVAEKVTITADTNVKTIENGAFSGASALKELYILVQDAGAILPPADFSGTHRDFTIYVPEGSFYDTDYFWSQVPGIADMLQFAGE